MTNPGKEIDWNTTTWEGSRREQLRAWCALTLRERLLAVEEMTALSDQFAQMRAQGRMQYPEEKQKRDVGNETVSGVRESGQGYGQGTESNEIVLDGCTPTPLAHYLKALGVLRLLSAKYPDICGRWNGERFMLRTSLDRDAIARFFLEDYEPTPVLAPWNGGSGFYPKDNRKGIDPIEQSQAERFAPYKDAIRTIRNVFDKHDISEKPEGEAKAALLNILRGELNEQALEWFDAAVLLTEESPKYPPLLGTGGNDGRLDFTNNFMQRLVGLFDTTSGNPTPEAKAYLSEALFAVPIPGLQSTAVGQFSPGSAGGANQASGFSSDSLINPWDFILMLEGALLFAAAATRRLESRAPGALSYPFTVRPTGAGSGSTALGDESNARAEMWLPLWSASTSLAELKSLLTEGRVTIGRQPARDGLGFIRAISKLGVDRGIVAFQRYAFMMRAGKAYFATPLNRVEVTRNPAADLIDELDGWYWLSRFRSFGRGANVTNRIQLLVRRLEDALFELAQVHDYPALKIQRVLEVLGEAQLYFAHSPAARESCPPVPGLSENWLMKADDNSPEFAIAAALAGLHGRKLTKEGKPRYLLPMRGHLAPEQGGRQPVWLDNGGHQVTWGHGRLENNLLTTLQRRLLIAEQQALPDKPFYSARNAPLTAIAAWLEGSLDNSRITSLLPGLTLVRIPSGPVPSGEHMSALPAAYRVLKPFFCTDKQLHDAGMIEADRQLSVPAELVRRLAADDIGEAVKLAQRRLRIVGIPIDFLKLEGGGINGQRLLAALMVPISHHELKTLLPRRAKQPPEPEMTE